MNATITPAQLLGEFVEPLGRALTPDSARALLAIQASDAARQHISELAERCNHGKLSPEEKAEYELLVDVGDMIALLQARARVFLRQQAA